LLTSSAVVQPPARHAKRFQSLVTRTKREGAFPAPLS
jgi:hypothetical protein